MKALVLILTLETLFLINIFAQAPVIRNINVYYKDQKAIINYDLKNFKANKKHNIELFFVDEKFNVRVPKKLYGDYGDSIPAGKNKQIQWALFEDNVNFSSKLQPVILADGLNKGGSSNVLLSILIPGLGDYFVENPRNMVFKPYLRTITALGSIALGVIADKKRVKLVWKTWDSRTNSELGWNWKDDYWLFEFDKEVFYFAGISIWIMDILWVYSKGNQNERLKTFTKYNPSISVSNGFTNFGLNIEI